MGGRTVHTGEDLLRDILDRLVALERRRIESTGGGGGGGDAPDATASVKGILRLTGDLGGTAATPTVPGLAAKADAREVRSATAGGYSYLGTAPAGTAEGSSGWTVARITISPPTLMHGTGTWTGRVAIPYS